MSTYEIRFNVLKGEEGHGSIDHGWEVYLDEGQETDDEKTKWLAKSISLEVPTTLETGNDRTKIVCEGTLAFTEGTDSVVIT